MSPSEGDSASDSAPRSAPDGGKPVDSNVFTQTSDAPSRSRLERVRAWFDAYIGAPFRIAWDDYRTRFGLIVIAGYVLMGTLGVVVVPEPRALQGPSYLSPFQSLEFPFGTDAVGRNLFFQTVHSTPDMFKMILAGALLSVGVGTVLGTISGFKSGKLDVVLMSLTDVVLTVPGLALVIVIAAFYPAESPYIVGLILGIDNWPTLARNVRSQVLSLREESYVEASRAMDLPVIKILRKDFISHIMPYISINLANSARRIIFESVALYYLGILPFTTQNWGVMLNSAYNNSNLRDLGTLHWIAVPMLTIALLTLALILFAQGLDRVFNVRLKARHTSPNEEEGGDVRGL